MNITPVVAAIFRVEVILYLLVVIDFGVNKPPTPIYDLTSGAYA
jgi:hypothetical protein